MVGTVPIDQNMRFNIGPPLRKAQRPVAACGAKRYAPAFWDRTSKRDTVNQDFHFAILASIDCTSNRLHWSRFG
jgi:hypothetical protein